MWKNRISLIVAVLALVCLTSCNSRHEKKTEQVIYCNTIVAKVGTIENKWYYVGEVEAKTSTSVGFRLPGTVSKVLVDEGQRVRKGQLLAELDPQDVTNSYDMARATLNQAEDAMRRVEMMHREQSISDIKYVEVQTKLDQARSMYAAAKKRLSDTRLFAPVDGVIGKRSIEVGENYGMLLSAFTILDLSEVKVKVPIPEREIPKVHKGDEACIRVLALGDSVVFRAKVDDISVVGDALTHSYEVYLRVDNHKGQLMQGMVCNVQLWPRSVQGQSGIVLPVDAVKVNTGNDHYVWVVRHGRAYRQKVSVGMYSKNGVVVYNGIKDGDHIIVEGQNKVSEGHIVNETVKAQ